MVKPGEIGMIVGKVRDDVLSKFEGYTREFCFTIPSFHILMFSMLTIID